MSYSSTHASHSFTRETLKAAYDVIFGDPIRRRSIFDMVDELDVSAEINGEAAGLHICYAVELTAEGYTVMRQGLILAPGEAAPIPPGYIEVYCRITSGFATDEWLGPVWVERPVLDPERERYRRDYGLTGDFEVLSENLVLRMLITERSFWPTLSERYPFLASKTMSARSGNGGSVAGNFASQSSPISPTGAASLTSQPCLSTSGLSPPHHTETQGHSDRSCPAAPTL